MALFKWPVTLSNLGAERRHGKTRNMKAKLPPSLPRSLQNKQKETYKYWIALSAQDHPRELWIEKKNKAVKKEERERKKGTCRTILSIKNTPRFYLIRIYFPFFFKCISLPISTCCHSGENFGFSCLVCLFVFSSLSSREWRRKEREHR